MMPFIRASFLLLHQLIGFGFLLPFNVHFFLFFLLEKSDSIQVGQFFYVFGSDMYATGPDMWDFATDGTFVIGVGNPFTPPDQWQYLESFIPQSNANLILGTAVTEYDGYIYILGLQGTNTVLSRIPTPNFMKLDWSQLMFYGRENNVLSWYPSSPSLQLQPLLTDPPITETTLQFHPYLNQWFMLVIHPFGTEVQITMASNVSTTFLVNECFNCGWNS